MTDSASILLRAAVNVGLVLFGLALVAYAWRR
jgi:hypothetical protein